ncbi:MAG: neutral zinc metallopeptidase [Myxococcota bacterium]|nr:neutral zinc metallopeptidase [Myxococcota bacterium]
MKLGGYRESGNVVDRRGMGRGMRLGGLGLGGTLIVAVISMLLGVDPRDILQGQPVDEPSAGIEDPSASAPVNDAGKQFVAKVLASTEDVWSKQVDGYREPKLVLFNGAVDSACGMGESAMGPFYCPRDQQVYLDLAFYRELSRRFNAPGDFAEAYVIAHEVGHHVQNLIGVFEQTAQARQGPRGNAVSVRTELQADCLAGVWAHHAGRDYGLLEAGDIEEGLNAASAVGDDNLQRETRGRVVPDSFTHGTSAQRVRWFKKGVETGDSKTCDTFATAEL